MIDVCILECYSIRWPTFTQGAARPVIRMPDILVSGPVAAVCLFPAFVRAGADPAPLLLAMKYIDHI